VSAFTAPKGTADVLPPESARFAELVARFARLARTYAYGLVVGPLFEDVGVFRRGVGEGSDVVAKEMYEFEDKGGRRLALRPEGTASVVRAYVEHRPPVPWKVWYATPAFRYERPQAGRYRQHHQLGVEAIGSGDPDLDVEVIALAAQLYEDLGLRRVELRVNSMGDAACLPGYRAALLAYLEAHEAELCAEHRGRFRANPLRVLDCKDAACVGVRSKGAPRLSEALCDECRAHFARVTRGLDALGVAWRQDDALVRGFDYYTRTTFEFGSLALDAAQNAVGGGGRYDGLVEALGGPPTPGIGFALGIERILLACDAEGALSLPEVRLDAYVIDLTGGEAGRDVAAALRRVGVATERGFDGRSLKAQLRAADRSGARLAVIVGEEEARAGTVAVRVLRGPGAGTQSAVSRAEVVGGVRAALDGLLADSRRTG